LQNEEVLFFEPEQNYLEENLLTESFLQTNFDFFYLNLNNSFKTFFPFLQKKQFVFFKNNITFFKFLNFLFLFFKFLSQLLQKLLFFILK
jgi:hypothetical protein